MSHNEGREEAASTFTDCRDLCEDKKDCMQYRFANGKCALSSRIMLGDKNMTSSAIQSGWMAQRIDDFLHHIEPCDSESWILH